MKKGLFKDFIKFIEDVWDFLGVLGKIILFPIIFITCLIVLIAYYIGLFWSLITE